jgi:hypothetical protein
MKLTTPFTSLLSLFLLSQLASTVVSSPLPESKPPARSQKDSTWEWGRDVHEVGVRRATAIEYGLIAASEKEQRESTTAWFKRVPMLGFITVDGVRKLVG